MASSRTTYDHDASAEEAVQGDVVGLIQPPPALRPKIDKTAQFVAKNGPAFEKKILASAKGKSGNFAFLQATNPFHAYYRAKIEEFQAKKEQVAQAGTGDKAKPDAGKAEDQRQADQAEAVKADAAAAVVRVALMNPIVEARRANADKAKEYAATAAGAAASAEAGKEEEGRAVAKPSLPPPPLPFATEHPSYLQQRDIDRIKLVAQYTAVSGRAFLQALAAREEANPDFSFLRTTHPLFTYFQRLVDQYSLIIRRPPDLVRHLEASAASWTGALQRSVQRLDKRRQDERSRAGMRGAAAAAVVVNWHDFVVVETVTFSEDDRTGRTRLAKPITIVDLQKAGGAILGANSDAKKTSIAGAADAIADRPAGAAAGGGEDMDVEMEASTAPRRSAAASASAAAPSTRREGGIVITTAHKPRVVSQAQLAESKAVTHAVDPRTGQHVPLAAAEEHLHNTFIDPSYKEQMQRHRDNRSGTGLAADDSLSKNLSRMVAHRPDVAGGEEATVLAKQAAEREAANKKVTWDGNMATLAATKAAAAAQAPPSKRGRQG